MIQVSHKWVQLLEIISDGNKSPVMTIVLKTEKYLIERNSCLLWPLYKAWWHCLNATKKGLSLVTWVAFNSVIGSSCIAGNFIRVIIYLFVMFSNNRLNISYIRITFQCSMSVSIAMKLRDNGWIWDIGHEPLSHMRRAGAWCRWGPWSLSSVPLIIRYYHNNHPGTGGASHGMGHAETHEHHWPGWATFHPLIGSSGYFFQREIFCIVCIALWAE